jgi:isochorismate synthase
MSAIEIEQLLHSRQPFAICALPGEQRVHTFCTWQDGQLRNDAGEAFVIHPESLGTYDQPQRITTQEEHHRMVMAAVAAIEGGTAKKVIISTIKHVARTADTLSSVFERLLTTYPSAFRYLLHHPLYGTWAGASPELLLKREGMQYSTIALAGTLKTEAGQAPVWNDKLIEEQAIVTRGITAHLQGIGVTDIRTSAVHNHTAGPVTHLKTDIAFHTDIDPATILSALHPTAAVCGYPKAEAMQLYRSLEQHERRLYTGYLGIERPEGFAYFVNLRCMQIFDDHCELHVGGGITAASIAKDEWEETENKAEVMRRVIGG